MLVPTHEQREVKHPTAKGQKPCLLGMETLVSKPCHLQEEEQRPAENPLKNKFRKILLWPFPTQDKEPNDQLQRASLQHPTSKIKAEVEK